MVFNTQMLIAFLGLVALGSSLASPVIFGNFTLAPETGNVTTDETATAAPSQSITAAPVQNVTVPEVITSDSTPVAGR